MGGLRKDEDYTPVCVFHERYRQLRSKGITDREIAERAGWWRKARSGKEEMVGDTARLLRALGLKDDSQRRAGGGRIHYRRERVGYETAVKLTRALELDPVDVGV